MTIQEWVTLVIIVTHFVGLITICVIDPSNLSGRR